MDDEFVMKLVLVAIVVIGFLAVFTFGVHGTDPLTYMGVP